MPLSTFDELAAVKSGLQSGFGGPFDALGIDYTGAWILAPTVFFRKFCRRAVLSFSHVLL